MGGVDHAAQGRRSVLEESLQRGRWGECLEASMGQEMWGGSSGANEGAEGGGEGSGSTGGEGAPGEANKRDASGFRYMKIFSNMEDRGRGKRVELGGGEHFDGMGGRRVKV